MGDLYLFQELFLMLFLIFTSFRLSRHSPVLCHSRVGGNPDITIQAKQYRFQIDTDCYSKLFDRVIIVCLPLANIANPYYITASG